MKHKWLILFFVFLSPILAFSYTVVRKDGKLFTGVLVRQDEKQVILKLEDGTNVTFRTDQIDWERTTKEIQKSEEAASAKPKSDETNSSSDQSKKFEPITVNEAESTGNTRWKGEPMSFDFKDIDIRDFFRLLADIGHFNLILDPQVKGSITLKLNDVPWDQALDLVCRTYGLGYELYGDNISVKKF
ncbi:MAG TPA: secretin and TonB N-terminal domain-containing protein [Acidobacteriota bacterium]|nr:secretin and TonB N-terminal domain-containing protein [Acidobacteriota bacterium]